ncbi:MAG: PDDEXK nuclease domain-containing protein [Methylomonas sp.]|jgi:predicted nuclease of restriction endonuclease-like (RecB) superfamily
MTASYWEIGRRILEFEQGGEERAGYKQQLLKRLSQDLTNKFGRGFSVDNLELMRLFYHTYSPERISETLSRKLPVVETDRKSETVSRILSLDQLATAFPLSWSHYVHLLRGARSAEERDFYEAEALRCGWSVRQLNRQINSAFYTRALLSKNKVALLHQAEQIEPGDLMTAEEAIKDPFVLEFLNLKDQYSESDLEEALIQHLADFLLELGDDFAFVGRQRRLRLDDTWFRIDLLFFHRPLKCLVVIDLKVGKFSYADAGQMHLYLNYAREHWMKPGENPPVGLILRAAKGAAEAHYALDNLPNKVLAAEYQTVLPNEKLLAEELERSRIELEARRLVGSKLGVE